MSTDLNASFNEQFMNINTKMKKRFMRKPNISEATNEFIALAIQSEHSDQPVFAAHCYVCAAKCEATAGNVLGEAEHYLTAARQFMKAEKKLYSLKFFSPDRENLEAAIGCYLQAQNKYPETSPLRTSILMELANELVFLNHKHEAMCYFQQALPMITESTMKLMFMKNLLNMQIDCGKFDMALETGNEIMDSNFNIPENLLIEIQVCRILLALVVKPPEKRKPASLKQLLSDLMDDNETDLTPFNTDLRLKLQSLVLSAATGDAHSIIGVAADTKHLLTTHQTDLLQKLVTEERDKHLTLG